MYIISRLPETSSAGSYIIALCIQKGNGMIDDHIRTWIISGKSNHILYSYI